MLPIRSKTLDSKARKRLKYLQSKVNKEKDFAKKASKAKTLWNGKKGSIDGRTAFEIIEETLIGLTISEKTCNYCEHNEASDIEHIDPKSFFPEKCFQWNNYLLACKSCNSEYKLDKCNTLNAAGDLELVPRGTKPKNKQVAFINPRKENPSKFLLLNLQTFTFELNISLSKREENKAKSTIDILKLNNRDQLISSRKSAARHYFEMLKNLDSLLSSNSKQQLKALLNPFDGEFDFNLSLAKLKKEIKDHRKKYIQSYQHPSVWHSMKLHHQQKPKLKELFIKLPEALSW